MVCKSTTLIIFLLSLRAATLPSLDPPEDPHVTTLYVGGLDETITEEDLRDNFYAFGEIRSISVVAKQGCAFVQYTRRASAEVAAEKTFNKLVSCRFLNHLLNIQTTGN